MGDNDENNDTDVVKRVIEMRNSDPKPSQQEVADELGISQPQVSRIESAHSGGFQSGKEEGKEKGMEEAFDKVRNFQKDDVTESHEEDDYWCNYCKDEGKGKVEVSYLQAECPNGHDLSEDWSGV